MRRRGRVTDQLGEPGAAAAARSIRYAGPARAPGRAASPASPTAAERRPRPAPSTPRRPAPSRSRNAGRLGGVPAAASHSRSRRPSRWNPAGGRFDRRRAARPSPSGGQRRGVRGADAEVPLDLGRRPARRPGRAAPARRPARAPARRRRPRTDTRAVPPIRTTWPAPASRPARSAGAAGRPPRRRTAEQLPVRGSWRQRHSGTSSKACLQLLRVEPAGVQRAGVVLLVERLDRGPTPS